MVVRVRMNAIKPTPPAWAGSGERTRIRSILRQTPGAAPGTVRGAGSVSVQRRFEHERSPVRSRIHGLMRHRDWGDTTAGWLTT